RTGRRADGTCVSALPGTRLCAAAITLGALAAQDPAATAEWRAPDGSRFLLVPDRSAAATPVVHWVVAVPTPLDDDPPAALGLSRAAVRASLAGTWRYGSADPDREAAALDALATLRARLHEAGDAASAELRAELDAARQAAAALADPTAWRRTLTRAPAADPQLHELEG